MTNALHTIAVIQEALKEGEISPDQYVTFTLVENARPELIPYVGEGLNSWRWHKTPVVMGAER